MRNGLLIVFFFLTMNCLAQTPDYFGQNQKWVGGFFQYQDNNFSEENEGWSYFVVGDTVVNSITYNKIYKNGWYTLYWGSQLINAYSYDSTLAFLLRQQGHKIYYYDYGFQADTLWVDYGLQIGDTIQGKMAGSFTAYVDSIDTLTLYGEPHRRLFLNQFSGGTGNVPQLIEGIGYFNDNNSNSGSFSHLSPDGFGVGYKLSCYAKNDSTVYSRISQPCTFNSYIEGLSVDEKELAKIQLFPNPSADRVNIESSEPIEKVIIYALNGKEIQQMPFLSKSAGSICVDELKPGIYICKIVSINGRSFVEKLIIGEQR